MAGRTHGRNARIYIDTASTPAAAGAFNASTATQFLSSWSIDNSVDLVDTTSFGDTTKVSVAGLPSASGTMSGFVNLGTATFKNLVDGNPRSMYLYPDSNTSTFYWFATCVFGGTFNGGVGDAIKVDLNWTASSSLIPNGTF